MGLSEYEPPIDPMKVRKQYSKSLKEGVILLTAHSHRAWPNVAWLGQKKAIELAQGNLDRKWGVIFGEVIPRFQELVSSRIGSNDSSLLANDENTHNLVTKVLSCYNWDSRTRFVTTSSEFHSLKRQLLRLKKEGVNVDFVGTEEKNTLTQRIVEATIPGTSAVLVSTVFYDVGYVLQDLPKIVNKARSVGATVLFDAYHQFNTRRLNVDALGDDIFVVGGGYKYGSAGEGAAWLKVPKNCSLEPRITGWLADFESLEKKEYPYPVLYGTGASRFLGATRDISGICRQVAVLEFMEEEGMSVDLIEQNTHYQLEYLQGLFDDFALAEQGLTLISSRKRSERGPFLAVGLDSKERAHQIAELLHRDHDIWVDYRGNILRIGPAPYTTKTELDYAMNSLKKVVKVTNQ